MIEGRPELGDRIERALKLVGVDKEFMERVLGHECKCGDRQEMINQLDRWARRVLKGQVDKAKDYLRRMQ